jgi:hypothetical protein
MFSAQTFAKRKSFGNLDRFSSNSHSVPSLVITGCPRQGIHLVYARCLGSASGVTVPIELFAETITGMASYAQKAAYEPANTYTGTVALYYGRNAP